MKERIPMLLAAVIISVTSVSYLINSKHSAGVLLHNDHDKNIEKENPLSAQDALTFTSLAANYPNKTLPNDAYAKAMGWYKADREEHKKNLSVSTAWLSIGPNNIGGRTIGFAIDPTDTSIIWLGSASGGLWKSTTGGIGTAAWTLHPFGVPALGVSSIAINPTNHLEMYAGTGEVYSDSSYSQGIINIRATRGSYGMGLFKSTDGGNTWTQTINWTYQQNLGIWDVVYNPLKTSTVYVAATNGIWKTTNSGANWVQIFNTPMVMSLVIHDVDTNVLLCGVGNYGSTIHGVYRTSNSGATWSVVATGLPSPTYQGRITLSMYSNNNDTMYAHICEIYNTLGIYLSTDKGNTWVQQSSTDEASYQGWYAKGLLAKPGSPGTLLVGGVWVFGSTDMGMTFTEVDGGMVHSDIHGIFSNPINGNMAYLITDGGLYRTNNFGGTYYPCVGGYVTSQHYIGSISSTDTTVLLSGLQDNNTIKYFGSQTWYSEIGGDGCYNAIDHTNDNIQYGAYQYLNVGKSTNQGNFFNTMLYYAYSFSDNYNYAAFLAPYILSYSNTNYIYTGATNLMRSTNGGNTFSVMGNNPVNNGAWIMCIAGSYTNTDSIYFCTAPDSTLPFKMFFSTDGGATVSDISSGLPDRYPRRIAVNPANSAELYIVFSGFGTGHVYRSQNSGKNWTDISTALPDMPFETVTVDPMFPRHIFAGCDFGAFYSTDDGATWTSYDTGFPDATEVFDLLVSPSDHYLYAFTHGRGVYKRDLSDIPTGINDISNASLTARIYPNPAKNELHINISDFSSDLTTGNLQLTVYNLLGKEVYNSKLTSSNFTVPVSELTAGVYLVTVKNNTSTLYSSKFVKE